ncbi:MAG: hypothetical protein KJP00_12345 [Bacteroidia bacterium]|nr:hypothetical protein [Bacteroidia bacterium]
MNLGMPEKMIFKKYIFLILVSGFSTCLLSQEYDLAKFNRTRLRIERRSIQALALWSAGSLVYNGLSTKNTSAEDRYFHQSNVYWNAINMGFVYAGFRHVFAQDPLEVSIYNSIQEQRKIEQLLFLSSGMDLAFIMTGLYLKERSKDSTNKDKINGVGRSFVLQGAVLLGFDLVQLVLHKSNNKRLKSLIRGLQFGPGGLMLKKQF